MRNSDEVVYDRDWAELILYISPRVWFKERFLLAFTFYTRMYEYNRTYSGYEYKYETSEVGTKVTFSVRF